MKLPYSSILPIHNLAAAYANTTNSYKFYWFLSILSYIKKGKQEIYISDLAIEMITEIWYPINYYRLSFGKQDKFDNIIQKIQQKLRCERNIKKNDLKEILLQNKEDNEIKNLTETLTRYVPARFLAPWFRNELKNKKDYKKNEAIILLSEKNRFGKNVTLYYFKHNPKRIIINDKWLEYLEKNLSILKGFTYWHLINYLQKNNPYVLNIQAKIFPPEKRNLVNAKKFWDTYFERRDNVKCIYSNRILYKENYCIDHFLPWSFVGHDQLWNLAPTIQEINSSKGDKLPSRQYLDKFLYLQLNAFHTVITQFNSTRISEDYVIVFNKTLDEIKNMTKTEFFLGLRNTIEPQIQIALNMGFPTEWKTTTSMKFS